MRKQNKYLIPILIIVALIVLQVKFDLLAIFEPSEQKPIQYHADYGSGFGGWTIAQVLLAQYGGTPFATTGDLRNTGATEDPFFQSIFSNVVEINTGKNIFKFVAEKTGNGVDFGLPPLPDSSWRYGCFQRIDVYKNNFKESTIVSWDASNYDKNFYNGKNWRFYDDETETSYIELRMISSDNEAVFGYPCRWWFNSYEIKLADSSFLFDISTPTKVFVQGQEVIVNVNIYNNLDMDVLGKVSIDFRIPTLFGDSLRTEIKEMTLHKGMNKLNFTFPANAPAEKLEITSTLEVNYIGSNLKGLNFQKGNLILARCFNTRGDGSCEQWRLERDAGALKKIEDSEWVPIGIVKEDTQIISISPRPLFIEKLGDDCPLTYIISNNGEYCVRDDVAELSCFILGCPTIEGTEYQCTSAGICAETIFVDKKCESDEMCPLDTTCDIDTGMCIKTKIVQELVQCQDASDCPIPCDGKTAICTDNDKCGYIGDCNVVGVGCVDYGCAEGYECNNVLNVCQKTLTSKDIMIYLIIGFSGLVLLLIMIALYKRKK